MNFINQKYVLFILLLSTIFTLNLYSFQDNEMKNGWIEIGDSLFAKNDLKTAKDAYKKALKINKQSVEAYSGLGRIAIKEENWGEALEQFGSVIDLDNENTEAYYSRGIGYRERGKFKALLLRTLDWNKSKKQFELAISLDSLYKDVFYQYGKLKRYQDNFREAISLGHLQIDLKSDVLSTQLGLFKFYQYYLRNSNEDEVINWLGHQPWDHAKYFKAEKLRREEKFDEAKSILTNLMTLNLPIPQQPILLSLAKLYYKQAEPQKAEKYYWRAINSVQEELGANLVFEDLKYIITDSEYEKFNSLKTNVEWRSFFREFWLSRNPLPAAQVNERLKEHYTRLLYAEKNYEYDGFRTWFNNPDKLHYLNYPKSYSLNQEFNDKGLIYIRQGQADDWAVTVHADVESNESWLYYETQFNPRMTFHFLKENSPGNNWRLAPYIDNPYMLEDRLDFGSEYYRLLRADPLEVSSLINQMTEDSKKSVTTALTTDRHTWTDNIEPLHIPFSMVTYRGKGGKTQTEIYYAVSTEQFDTNIPDSLWNWILESGVAIHDLQWNEVFNQTKESSLMKPPPEFKAWIDLFRFDVAPDTYQIALHARPNNSNLLGGYKFGARIPNYQTSNLSVSDILLAEHISPDNSSGLFTKNGLKIIPIPTSQFVLDKPVFLYFEIYQLSLNSSNRTSYSIEYTLKLLKKKEGGFKKVFGFLSGKSKSTISIKSDREGDSEFGIEYLGIAVSKLDQGDYELSVLVTDKTSAKSISKTKKLFLTK